MNREYWLGYIEFNPFYSKRAIIKDIYDNFKLRTCENCKHCDKFGSSLIHCDYFEQLFPTEIGSCKMWDDNKCQQKF